MMTGRIRVLALLFGICLLVVLVRLWFVQFPLRQTILERGAIDYDRSSVLQPVRGSILDAHGTPLAQDRCSWDVHLVPSTYRERSLLYAISDLLILTTDAERRIPLVESNVLFKLRHGPENLLESFTSLPAWTLTPEEIPTSTHRILASQGGTLLRGPEELRFRIRQASAVVRGQGGRLTMARFRDLDRSGTIGKCLEVTPTDLLLRLDHELRAQTELAAHLGHQDRESLWEEIQELIQDEMAWVDRQYQKELRSSVALEVLGHAELHPRRMGAEAWSEFARGEGARPFGETDEEVRAASTALIAVQAILGGRIPVISEDDLSSELLAKATSMADRFGISDLKPESVAQFWFEEYVRQHDIDEQEYVTKRRRRYLRNRDRGGRAWRVGGGLPGDAALSVVGPGRLGELGFRLRASFSRDDVVSEALPTSIRMMLGEVSRRARRGSTGVEARLDRRLQGVPGDVLVDRKGHVLKELDPVHGETIQLSLSLELQHEVDALLASEPAAGVAVIDVTTGGILAMGTSPPPPSLDAARLERQRLSRKLIALRRFRRNPDRLRLESRIRDLLEQDSDATEDAVELLSILQEIERHDDNWVGDEIVRVLMAEARSIGWHRAYESAGSISPGSVFKAITVLAGLAEGAIAPDQTFNCVGTRNRRWHRCKDHGPGLDPVSALAHSCNEFCYQVADLLSSDVLVDFYGKLGYFDPIPGLLPAVRQSHIRNLRMDQARNLCIGGGSLNCPPVRAAGLAASLATGRVVRPWLAPPSLDQKAGVGEAIPGEHVLQVVRDGMKAVCSAQGTARRHLRALSAMDVAAKTGTHDMVAADGAKLNQAWFVGFAPARNPRFAFAVVYHFTKQEGADAAPLAVKVLDACGRVFGAPW